MEELIKELLAMAKRDNIPTHWAYVGEEGQNIEHYRLGGMLMSDGRIELFFMDKPRK